MSPQEAAELLDVLKEHHSIIPATHKAMSLAVAALEREAKAEPVAWRVRIPRGTDTYEIRFASIAEQLREMEAKWPLALVEPLYASPPAPESGQ